MENEYLLEHSLVNKFEILRHVDKLLSDTEDDMILISDTAYKMLCSYEDDVLNDIVDTIEKIRLKK